MYVAARAYFPQLYRRTVNKTQWIFADAISLCLLLNKPHVFSRHTVNKA